MDGKVEFCKITGLLGHSLSMVILTLKENCKVSNNTSAISTHYPLENQLIRYKGELTMMKKMTIKVNLAVMLVGQLLTLSSIVQPNHVSAAATTVNPVMTDNFFKYGMEKTQDLPATITADGLSYTLHKVMIYDVNSKDAQTIWKKYKFLPLSLFPKAKYLVWTKITITNKTTRTVRRDMYDLSEKWTVTFDNALNNGETVFLTPGDPKYPVNSKEALGDFILKPNQSLTTYEAYYAKVNPRYFFVTLLNGSTLKTLYLVDPDGERK